MRIYDVSSNTAGAIARTYSRQLQADGNAAAGAGAAAQRPRTDSVSFSGVRVDTLPNG
jgi:hypothetical protein